MKHRTAIALKRVALLFLVLAVACLGGIAWIQFAGRDAVFQPVTLQNDFRLTREFQVHSNAHYRIELRCSRTIPFEQLKRLLESGNVVDITLTEDDAPAKLTYLAGSSSALGFAADYISQDIAVFAAQTQCRYTLSCSVLRPISELGETNPTLVVGLDPLELEGAAFGTALLFVATLFFGVVSLVLWGGYLLRLRRARSSLSR